MNREIKFRGKRTDNGKWVYGYYYERRNDSGEVIEAVMFADAYMQVFNGRRYICSDLQNDECYKVIPETVGQYAGLKDKNDKEIYEGDICNCREYECFGKVEWNNEEAGFYFCVVLEGGGFEEEHLYDYADELEVIGNIHENPELLEVEE